MSARHDASYKMLFSMPEMVRDLIMGFIPDEWLHSLDYSTLEKMPGSYVTDDLRQRHGDVVWRVRADGEWIYLYLLIEFQYRVDAYMPVRMLGYISLLYQDLIRRKDLVQRSLLPPILPIVIYHGDRRWTAATDVADLLPAVPGQVADYLPRMRYCLLDISTYSPDQFEHMQNLMAAVIRLEQAENWEAIIALTKQLQAWLQDRPEVRRTFTIWIRELLHTRSRQHIMLPEIHDLEELNMTLAERFIQWEKELGQKGYLEGMEQGIEQGWEQGLQKGIQSGEARLLERQLAQRFGALPPDVHARISTAPPELLEAWSLRVLDARTLEEVLGNQH
jgi:predicted transposase/invertase (TIGR01784 family)